MSTGNSKTELDWAIYHGKQSPGPGAYNIPDMASQTPGGGEPALPSHGGVPAAATAAAAAARSAQLLLPPPPQ